MKTNVIVFTLSLVFACFAGAWNSRAQAPTISDFEPTEGVAGDSVVINGNNFHLAGTVVKFNGVQANFQASAVTQIHATVPQGATTGPISVANQFGTAISTLDFTVFNPGPRITDFNPKNAQPGEQVVLDGANFTQFTQVLFFDNVSAAILGGSQNQLTVTVPQGATTGPITVTNATGPALGSNQSEEDFVVVVPVDMGIEMVTEEEQLVANRSFTYLLTVTNHNTQNRANGVKVINTLPASVNHVVTVPSQGTSQIAGRIVTADLGPIDASGEATVRITVTPTTEGSITNMATVESQGMDTDPSNNSTELISDVIKLENDLAIAIEANPQELQVNETVTYTVTVTNNGSLQGTDVRVVDTLPGSLQFVQVLPSQGAVESSGQNVVVNLGNLAAGAQATVQIKAIVKSAGTISNTAMVTANEPDPNEEDNSASIDIEATAPSADLGITLTADPNPPTVGLEMTFIATVSNAGPAQANNVTATFDIPATLFYRSTSTTQGTSERAGQSVIANFGRIEPNASATLRVVGLPQTNATMSGAADVSGTETDPNLPNNSTTLNVTPAIKPHTIEIRLQPDGNILLSWPAFPVENRLQNALDLDEPIEWTNVNAQISEVNGINQLVVTPTEEERYFRLTSQ